MRGYIYIPKSEEEFEKAGKRIAGANGVFDTLFIDYDSAMPDVEGLPAKDEDTDHRCIFVGNDWTILAKEGDVVERSWVEIKEALLEKGWEPSDFILDDDDYEEVVPEGGQLELDPK